MSQVNDQEKVVTTPERSSVKDLADDLVRKVREAKEECLKRYPTLTHEEYDQIVEAYGF